MRCDGGPAFVLRVMLDAGSHLEVCESVESGDVVELRHGLRRCESVAQAGPEGGPGRRRRRPGQQFAFLIEGPVSENLGPSEVLGVDVVEQILLGYDSPGSRFGHVGPEVLSERIVGESFLHVVGGDVSAQPVNGTAAGSRVRCCLGLRGYVRTLFLAICVLNQFVSVSSLRPFGTSFSGVPMSIFHVSPPVWRDFPHRLREKIRGAPQGTV